MSYNAPLTQWSEPMLEGRYAELCAGIAYGDYTGGALHEAITERRLVWLEIVRCRVGESDDDDGLCGDWERWHYGSEGA